MPDVQPHRDDSEPLTIWLCDDCGPDLHTDHEIDCMHGGYKPVRVFREEAFSVEHREGDDGRGSHPARPSWDRPSSKWRRLVGPWERVR